MNMRHINKLVNTRLQAALLGSMLLFGLSCTKKFDQTNTDKNKIATVTPAVIPFLFSHAEDVATVNANNYQIAQNLFADQYAQYFACEATYFASDRLFLNQAWVGANFNPYYTDVLPQLQSIFTNTDSTSAEHALAEIIWVLAFQKATDYWGPIPYFSAGTVAPSVAYDPQDKIYDDFFKRLTAAVAVLTPFAGSNAYGSYDLIYGGDINKWIKFANTLRLRCALRVSKVDPTRAKTEAEAAVAAGVMTTSPDDDALILRSAVGGDNNGLSIMSDWGEFRMSATMASVLKGYQDPRIADYFVPTDVSGDPTPGVFAHYSGLRNGLSVDQLGLTPNLAAANSHAGSRWASTNITVGKTVVGTASYVATPQNVIETAEAYFLRAEGALLGWNMGVQTAQQLYEAGITQSMAQWGITGAPVTAYISSTKTPVAPGDGLGSPAVSNVPIAWSTDPVVELQQIMTQKWLGLYPDGLEAWADWRRSHVMKLYPVANVDSRSLVTDPNTMWVRRIPFLDSEKQTNGPAVTAAASLLGGPDNELTPLWWDKN
jgi:hypothetical protein